MIPRLKNIGPAALVTAAFIGPGTVTMCTLAGINTGHSLLWVMVLAIVTTISFQEMAARVGLCTKLGLSEAILERAKRPIGRVVAIFLILSAIFIGNAMYEAGNISGALLGVSALFPNGPEPGVLSTLLLASIAFILLYSGKYKLIERTLVISVALMAVAFLTAAVAAAPDLISIASGLIIPSIPEGQLMMIVGLIGTTVVPYNLFLHASTVREKWSGPDNLLSARRDTYLAVTVGGLISIAIIITASSVAGEVGSISNATDMASVLEPTFGPLARYGVAIGLFAAGLSSSITAPMGAAYAVSGLFGNRQDVYKATWIIILIAGVTFAIIGSSPVSIIKYAQVTNGILLPIIAIFLVVTVNDRKILGAYVNSKRQNLLAGTVLLITLLIAYRTLANFL
ncbi:MAG: Nramp family divalent metal transporter [Bacteroidota bacterium]